MGRSHKRFGTSSTSFGPLVRATILSSPPLGAAQAPTLKVSLGELNRLLERLWQASTQLAQVGGSLLGATVAAAAAILGGFRTIPIQNPYLDAGTGPVLVLSGALATDLASRSRDIGVGPKPESLGLAVVQSEA